MGATTPSTAALGLELPAHLGTVVELSALSRRTWLVETSRMRLVAKRLEPEFEALSLTTVLSAVAELPGRPCPRLRARFEADGQFWLLFEYVVGAAGQPRQIGLVSLVRLLERLATARFADWEADVLDGWLQRLGNFALPLPEADDLFNTLRDTRPTGGAVAVHGDFSLQNVVTATRGPVLVDWESAGIGPPEFDAGWLLAHARVGATPWTRSDVLEALATCRLDARALGWCEALGLLRMLYRALTLPMPERHRALVCTAISRVVADVVREH